MFTSINYEFNLLDYVGVIQKYMTGRTDGRMDSRTSGQPENIMLCGGGIKS